MIRIEHFEAEAAALAFSVRLLPDLDSQQRALAAALLNMAARVVRDAAQLTGNAGEPQADHAAKRLDQLADRYQEESLLRVVPAPLARGRR